MAASPRAHIIAFDIRFQTMSQNNEQLLESMDDDDSALASSNDVTTLQATLRKLQEENAALKRQQPNTEAAKQFFQGLTDYMHNNPLPAKPSTSTATSNSGTNHTGSVAKLATATNPNDPNLPDCYEGLPPKVKTDNTGPDIATNIANLLKSCWHVPFGKDEIVEILEEQVRPANVTAVKPLEVNPEVRLSKAERKKEQDLRYVGNAICAAGKGVAYLMDMCANAESKLRQIAPADNGWLNDDDFMFDFPKANRLLSSVAKVLGIANVQTGQARRLLLSSRFKPDYKKLCNPSMPFIDGKFFGPDFNATTSLITDAAKVQNTALQPSFSPRNKRRRGGTGYYNNTVLVQSPQSSFLQAAVMQQALNAAAGHISPPAGHTATTLPGTLTGIQQFPQQPPHQVAPPLFGIPTIASHRSRGRGRGRGRRGRGRRLNYLT